VTAARLQNMEVDNARGNNLGTVDQVLTDGKQLHVVVSYGGFLGIGERQVTLPLERFQLQGDRLVVPGMTDDQLRALPQHRQHAGMRPASPNQQANIPVRLDTTGQAPR
jgi:hypothetical protein